MVRGHSLNDSPVPRGGGGGVGGGRGGGGELPGNHSEDNSSGLSTL